MVALGKESRAVVGDFHTIPLRSTALWLSWIYREVEYHETRDTILVCDDTDENDGGPSDLRLKHIPHVVTRADVCVYSRQLTSLHASCVESPNRMLSFTLFLV